MDWVIVSSIYAAVALLTLRSVAGHFAWTFARGRSYYDCTRGTKPNTEQWFGAIMIALCLVCVWPLVCVWLLSARSLPAVGNERKQRLEDEQRELRELQTRDLRQLPR